MLRVASFTFNPFQENTHVIINDAKECWIIDPGMYGADEEKYFFSFIEKEQLVPKAIINTHTHIDHIFGVDAVKTKYGIPFGMHELDLPVLNNAPGSATLFGFDFRIAPQPDFFIKEGEALPLSDASVEVRLAPGHSPGSIVFYSADNGFVISGDVLFQGSVGRTDLPGGSQEVLFNSITSQLYTLPDNTAVYPGHGPVTNIGVEKRTNPFIRA